MPLVRGLGTTTPRLEGWKLCAVSKRTGKLETIDYHTSASDSVEHMDAALESAKRSARLKGWRAA